MRAETRKPTTALVLAGGGSFGAVQVGMLKALVAHGVAAEVDMVVGSSVGALNAAYFAGRPNAQGVAELERLWTGIRRGDIFPFGWHSLLGLILRRDFLVAPHGLRRLVEANLPYRRLEDAALALSIVATDLLTGEAVVLSRGPAAEAVVASCAIPAAFPAVRLDERYLADGALTSNTPVRIAVANGARRLIVLPTGYACSRRAPPQGALANALHALTLLIARQLVAELETLDADVEFHIVPTLCPLDGSPYEFGETAHLIARSAECAERWLIDGGLGRSDIPAQLRPHSHHQAS